MKLIIFGAPGAGKGTISEMLADKYKLKHISAGEVIRHEIQKKTVLGKEMKKVTEAGNLISDELISKLLKKILPKDNFILDGTPRTVDQKYIVDRHFTPDHVIFIDTTKKEILSRLSHRYECPKCGEIYGVNNKPKKKGLCNKDSSELRRRPDDNPKVIENRFKIYNKITKPILKLYKKQLIKVNGDRTPKEIFKDIKSRI